LLVAKGGLAKTPFVVDTRDLTGEKFALVGRRETWVRHLAAGVHRGANPLERAQFWEKLSENMPPQQDGEHIESMDSFGYGDSEAGGRSQRNTKKEIHPLRSQPLVCLRARQRRTQVRENGAASVL
jgi:hypothetical protein